MSSVRLEGLTRTFGDVTAVDDVHLSVPHGEFLVLLGPSGCGKSTLLRMIAGLTAPSAGRVIVDDVDVTAVPARERDLAMVFQSYALYPHLSVRRNIAFPLRARRRPREEIRRKVNEAAALLDLTELLSRRPRELSGGQRQRVALGRALVRDPGAFLMDEPLSNLDARLRSQMRTELIGLHRTLGSTFVYVTHDQVEAMTMASTIALLNDGKLEQVGAPAEIYDEPASTFAAGFLGSPPMNLIDATVTTAADGALRALAQGVDLLLPYRSGAASMPDVDVVLGFRPEHVRLIAPADPAAAIGGVVHLVENHGGDEIARIDVGNAQICHRGARPLGVVPGERVACTLDPRHIHLFDRNSGRRLIWQPNAHSGNDAGPVNNSMCAH